MNPHTQDHLDDGCDGGLDPGLLKLFEAPSAPEGVSAEHFAASVLREIHDSRRRRILLHSAAAVLLLTLAALAAPYAAAATINATVWAMQRPAWIAVPLGGLCAALCMWPWLRRSSPLGH